ncbi:MAG: site-2 protease family protein [Oscillospiraceae bacterium]
MSEIINNLDWSVITDVFLSVIPALICITLHELSHGFVAYKLGDNTAKRMGRLTLNPIKHIDPMGLFMMVIFKFGWAKPVPIDMRRFKNPKRGMAITALAGPVSNLLIAVVALALYGVLYPFLNGGAIGGYVLQMVYLTAYISIAFAVFNIIPIPPLDGSKVLFSFLSDENYLKLMRYERYGMLILILLIATNTLSSTLGAAVSFVWDKLFYISQFAFDTVSKFM